MYPCGGRQAPSSGPDPPVFSPHARLCETQTHCGCLCMCVSVYVCICVHVCQCVCVSVTVALLLPVNMLLCTAFYMLYSMLSIL